MISDGPAETLAGYVAMGPYRGGMLTLEQVPSSSILLIKVGKGQAQYIRIPYADFNALKLPPGKEHESDFILLAGMGLCNFLGVRIAYSNRLKTDVFPTGVLPFPLRDSSRWISRLILV
jgi:hypothetical protein